MTYIRPANLLLLISAFFLGWLANDFSSLSQKDPQPPLFDSGSTESHSSLVKKPKPSILPPSQPIHKQQLFHKRYFSYLLNDHAYQEAIDFLKDKESEEATTENTHQLSQLRAISLQHLEVALQKNTDSNPQLALIFDHYLNQQYDDIEMLVLLARYHQKQNYIEESLQTIQLALTYAHQKTQQKIIQSALDQLVKVTEQALNENNDTIALLNFFELLDNLSLSKAKYQFRQAELYAQLDDFESARFLLTQLINNAEFSTQAKKQLALIEDKIALPHSETEENSAELPLIAKGNHYQLTITAKDSVSLALIIDTGASMTTLSKESFESLESQLRFTELGSHLFHTAGGVSRGSVYRLDSINIGEHMLENINIAVLDFKQAKGTDGLLGMNILKHFRFEIDQDKNLLRLHKRAR